MIVRPNWQIIWSVMREGIEVELHGLRYTIEEGKLCVRLDVYHKQDQTTEVRYVVSDLSVNDFIEQCSKIPTDKIAEYASNAVITRINKEGGLDG